MYLHPHGLEPQQGDADHEPGFCVPETILGERQHAPEPTHRSGPSTIIDHLYDFHPGLVAIRVDGPDIMAVTCDNLVDFTAAHLVTPDAAVELDYSVGMFVGTHDEHPVFRVVFATTDDSKRYSTGWIQR